MDFDAIRTMSDNAATAMKDVAKEADKNFISESDHRNLMKQQDSALAAANCKLIRENILSNCEITWGAVGAPPDAKREVLSSPKAEVSQILDKQDKERQSDDASQRKNSETGLLGEWARNAEEELKQNIKETKHTLDMLAKLAEPSSRNMSMKTLWRDLEGNPAEVIHPNGTTYSIEYDSWGSPSEIEVTRSESVQTHSWRKEGDSWRAYDDEGNEIGARMKDIFVSEDGSITFMISEGAVSLKPDGSVTRFFDGYSVTRDVNGLTTELKRQDGTGYQVQYNARGDEQKVAHSDGSYLEKQGKAWFKYDQSGKLLETFEGDLAVQENGEMEVTYPDGRQESFRVDGSRTLKAPLPSKAAH